MNFLNLPKAQHNATPSWEKRSDVLLATPKLKETEPVKPMNKGGRPRKADQVKELKKEHNEEVMAFIDTEPNKKDVYEYFRRKVQQLNDD